MAWDSRFAGNEAGKTIMAAKQRHFQAALVMKVFYTGTDKIGDLLSSCRALPVQSLVEPQNNFHRFDS